MRVTIKKKDIENTVSIASRAISLKSPLPILSHFLIDARTGALSITATDLEIGIESNVNANVIEEGAFTVPAKTFQEIINLLPDQDLNIRREGEELEISTEHSSTKLMTLPPDEFPIIPHFESEPEFVMSQKSLKDTIRNVIFASASQEETRAVLTGILISGIKRNGQEIEFIATDGRRLAKMRQPVRNEIIKETKVIVPSRALHEISRFLKESEEDVKISMKGGHIFFDMGSIFVLSRVLEGKFPDFSGIIPETSTITVTMERTKFMAAMKRALIMAQEKTNPKLVRMSLTEKATILRSYTPDLGSAYEEVPSSLAGEELEIAFNGIFVLDALSNLQSEEIEIKLSGNESPGVIRPKGAENYLYVVMPVKIKEEVKVGEGEL